MTSNVKIYLLNVCGLSDRKKRKDVFAWLRQENLSIYCLQDIHVRPSNETLTFSRTGGVEYV